MIDNFLLGCVALEAKFGVKRGGHRFWLFVANWLATLLLFAWLGLKATISTNSVWPVIFAGFVVSGCFVWVDIVKIWNGVVAHG